MERENIQVFAVYVSTDDPTVQFPLCECRDPDVLASVVAGLMRAMSTSANPREVLVKFEERIVLR